MSMLHVVKKIVHIEIEKVVETSSKTIRWRSIAIGFVFVGKRLTNKQMHIYNIKVGMGKIKDTCILNTNVPYILILFCIYPNIS